MVQRGGDWAPLLAVPNVTAHSSTASIPITVSLCNSLLLCSFNVDIKGLKYFLLNPYLVVILVIVIIIMLAMHNSKVGTVAR